MRFSVEVEEFISEPEILLPFDAKLFPMKEIFSTLGKNMASEETGKN
jgi:hypothetical protein